MKTTPSLSDFYGSTITVTGPVSLSDFYGSTITVTGPVVYMPDKIKQTRKQAYTQYLKNECFFAGYQCGYVGLPRKLKRGWKKWAEKWCYYRKGKVTRFYPPTLYIPTRNSFDFSSSTTPFRQYPIGRINPE